LMGRQVKSKSSPNISKFTELLRRMPTRQPLPVVPSVLRRHIPHTRHYTHNPCVVHTISTTADTVCLLNTCLITLYNALHSPNHPVRGAFRLGRSRSAVRPGVDRHGFRPRLRSTGGGASGNSGRSPRAGDAVGGRAWARGGGGRAAVADGVGRRRPACHS